MGAGESTHGKGCPHVGSITQPTCNYVRKHPTRILATANITKWLPFYIE